MTAKLGSVTVKGGAKMKAMLDAIIQKVPRAAKAAIYLEAELIMTDSKQNYVPVEFGTLMQSGVVMQPKIENGNIVVWMGYGGEAEPYAEAVHEHLSRHSPPSWLGKTVQFHPAGRGPKYLEVPFRKAQNGLANRVARTMQSMMGL